MSCWSGGESGTTSILIALAALGLTGTLAAENSRAEPKDLDGRLRGHVWELAERIGERNAWKYRQLQEAASYIGAHLAAAGLEVSRHPYRIADQEFVNVVGERRGRDKPEEIVMIGAHYDSVRGSPGADDNASGVAGVLELARLSAQRTCPRTVRFVAFVNEEPPFFQTQQMGSRVYADECQRRGDRIVAMLSLEMLGYYSDEPGSQNYPFPLSWFYPDTANFIAVVGNRASRLLVRELVAGLKASSAIPVESIAAFEFIAGVDFSDHASFWRHGIPAAMITDTAFNRYAAYHTAEDMPEKLDYARMAQVVEGLAGWLFSEGSQ